jgi:hypothetical protein
MSPKKTGGLSAILTTAQLKRKLGELTKEEIIDLFAETVKASKDIQALVSVKLQGEKAVVELLEVYKGQIRKEFFPAKGRAKQRVAVVEQLVTSLNELGKGTPYPFQLLVEVVETAAAFMQENGDIEEDMGLFLLDVFDEIVDVLNADDEEERYRQYQARLEAVLRMTESAGWDMSDMLRAAYDTLKWVEQDQRTVEEAGKAVGNANANEAISFAAMKQWLEIAEPMRKRILGNVFCGKCFGSTTMKDYTVEVDKFGLLLQGVCATCGHSVARVVD